MAATDKPKVYLPRMRVRPGWRHSYQGSNVVIVEPGKKEVTADEDAKVIAGPTKKTSAKDD